MLYLKGNWQHSVDADVDQKLEKTLVKFGQVWSSLVKIEGNRSFINNQVSRIICEAQLDDDEVSKKQRDENHYLDQPSRF